MTEQFNPCKARECSSCCQNVVLSMTLAELAVFSEKYTRKTNRQPIRLHTRIEVEEQKRLATPDYLNLIIWYSANKSLEQSIINPKYADKQALVYIQGICANNIDGECSIYEDRPNCCRNFALDSDGCKACQLSVKKFVVTENPSLPAESSSSLSIHSVPNAPPQK